jgi:hypothetical protein
MEKIQEIEFRGATEEQAQRKADEWLANQHGLKMWGRSVRHDGFGFDSSLHEWGVKIYYEFGDIDIPGSN